MADAHRRECMPQYAKILLDAAQFERADQDGDGLHTAAEALKILKYANGEIGSLQM